VVPRDRILGTGLVRKLCRYGTGSSFCFCSYNSRRWLLEIHVLSTVHSLQWATMTVVPPLIVGLMCLWRPRKRASTAVKDAHWQGHALVCKVWCLADDEQRKALALRSFTVWAGYALLVSWKTVRSVATWWGNKALSHRGSAKKWSLFQFIITHCNYDIMEYSRTCPCLCNQHDNSVCQSTNPRKWQRFYN